MTKPAGKNAFFFIIVTVLIDMLSFGIIMPVTPFLVADITGLSPEQAAPYGGYLSASYALMNFLASPTLGGLSDRYGRRPVLLFSMLMLGVDFVVMGSSKTLGILFLGRVLSGVSGATFSTANAYIADVTEPADRGRAYGMLGAAFGVGFILGPVVGGLLGDIGFRAPFFAAACLSLVNAAYGLFVLPESLPPESRRPFEWKRANPFGAIRHFARLPRVGWFIVGIGIYNFAHMVYPSSWAFYTEIRYGWTGRQIGFSLGVVGVGAAVVQAGLIQTFLRRLGASRTALVGLSIAVLSFALTGLASQPWMVYVIIPISAFGGLTMPAINSVMTPLVGKDVQGELQGAVASVQALGNVLSPLVMTQALSHFSRPDASPAIPGAPFLLAAVLCLAAIAPVAAGLAGVRRTRILAGPA